MFADKDKDKLGLVIVDDLYWFTETAAEQQLPGEPPSAEGSGCRIWLCTISSQQRVTLIACNTSPK